MFECIRKGSLEGAFRLENGLVLEREREEEDDGLGYRLWSHLNGMDLNLGSNITY